MKVLTIVTILALLLSLTVVDVDLALASSNNDEDEEQQEQEQEQEQEGIESEQTEEAQQQPVYQPDTGSGTITPLNETMSLYENREYGFNFTFPSAMFELGDIAGVTDLCGRQDSSIGTITTARK